MAAPPQNPLASQTAGPPPKLIVLLGDEDGNKPTLDDEVDFLIPLEIVRSAGKSPDYCRFELDLDRAGQRIVDLQTPKQFARQVEVRVAVESEVEEEDDDDGDEEDELKRELDAMLLFWGELNFSRPQIFPGGERIELLARVEDFHFGKILEGPRVWDPLDEEEHTLTEDVEFNPLVDGKILENMSDREFSTSEDRLWIDPESVRTAQARSVQDVNDPDLWTLDKAVNSMQELLNQAQEFVHEDLSVLGTISRARPDGIPELRNVRLARGRYLPEYLDALLHPWGFDWCLDYQILESTVFVNIRVFDRRSGPEKEVFFQRPGEDLSLLESNVPVVDLETNIVELANRILAHGSLQQREITVELYKGWDPAEDVKTADDLRISDPDSQYETFPLTWRNWVANEDGSFKDMRPEIPDVLDLSDVFDDYVPKRRRFEDCLKYDGSSTRRRPPLVQWWNPETEGWETVPDDWPYVVMRDRMGILFTKDQPPAELVNLGVNARIRVTGTVTGDKRVRVETDYDELSPQLRDVHLFLDLSDRFHDRLQQTSGAFESALLVPSGEAGGSDSVENVGLLEDYLLEVQKNEVSSTIRATLRLFGLQFGYEVGDLITKIDGRNVDLNRNFEGDNPRYVQVTELRWLVQEQSTVLVCEPAQDLT